MLPPVPPEQTSTYIVGAARSADKSRETRNETTTQPHQRHGDRGNADDAAVANLPRYLRYKDLVAAGLVKNWPTLLRWIEHEGFPPGRYLAPNTRAWPETEVVAWLESRPSAKPERAA
jgi:predicted DNA-binding transcriptional regulator AlpA